MPLSLPIAIPNATERFTRGGDAGSGSIDAFQVIELPAIQVAQRQMREVEIPHLPDGVPRGIAADGLPEEGQFESEPVAVKRFQISGVVPPFTLKIRVIEMIPREFVTVSRQGGAILRRKRLLEKQRGRESCEPSLHGRPQLDSSARPPAPGRGQQAQWPHTRPQARQKEFPPASETGSSSRTTVC